MINYRGIVGKAFMRICSLIPINHEKIVFSSFYGKYYNDSPRCIFEAMRELYPNLDYVWLMEDDKYEIEGARTVKFASFKSLSELTTAGVWVDDCRKREWMVKRKGQFYVQTWHAGLTLKKVEKDAQESLAPKYLAGAINDSQMADLFLSGCKWSTEKYSKSFWYNGEILEKGLPREDIFYRDPTHVLLKVKKYYNLKENDRIILYAPTFRVDGSTDAYLFDYKKLLECMESKFPGNWKVIVRLHPNIADKQNCVQYTENVLNGSQYQNIEELIVASDVLFTDYSSCAFDAMEAGKKVFMYATDIEKYANDRGTYFDLLELPFPLAQNEKELESVITNFNDEKYKNDVSAFMQMQGIFNNSHSSYEVGKYIYKKAIESYLH